MAKIKLVRNADDVLVCDHGVPLSEACVVCDMDNEYNRSNVAVWVLVAIAALIFLACGVVLK